MASSFRKPFQLWVPLFLAAAGLFSCNIFAPAGPSAPPKDAADAWVDLGQRALQDKNFAEAFADFARALSLDSSKSLAYQGLAKAELGKDSFPISRLVRLGDSITAAPDTQKISFLLGMGDAELNKIYRPLMRVARTYQTLARMEQTGHSDHAFAFHLVQNELSAILAGRSYFLLVDANSDTLISPSEIATARLLKLTATGLVLDPTQLAKLAATDSTGKIPDSVVTALNQVFTSVSNLAADTATISQIAAGANGDTASAATALSNRGLDFLHSLGSSTSMFLVNDSLDNDGDGCVNEEIYGDGLDNDGDSLVDEDARISLRSPGSPVAGALAFTAPPEGFLHDQLQLAGGRLALVSGNDEILARTWADGSGLLSLYQGLRWVRWDDPSVGNDTIWSRVVRENGYTAATVKSSPDYVQIRTLGIIEVRKKVLALQPDASRILLGKKIVGGCWDHVALP